MALIDNHFPGRFKFTISTKTLKHISPKNSIETEALCIQVKSPLKEVAKEIFGMIDQHCLGGGIRIIPQGVQSKIPWDLYANIMVSNNDFYNNTAFLTLTQMDESYWQVQVSVSKSEPKAVETTISGMKGVISVIQHDKIKGKFFILCQAETFIHNRQAIDNVLFSLKEAIKQRDLGTEAINTNKLYPSINIASRNSGYVNIRADALGKEFATTKKTKTLPKQQTEPEFNLTFETTDFPPINKNKRIAWKQPDENTIESNELGKTKKTAKTTSDQTQISEAMSVITKAFTELKRQGNETRRENACERKEAAKLRAEERKEDRENRKMELEQADRIRKDEAAERAKDRETRELEIETAEWERKAAIEERYQPFWEAKAQAENDAIQDREMRKNETAPLLANFSKLLAQTQLSHSQYVPQQALTQSLVSSTNTMHQSINQSETAPLLPSTLTSNTINEIATTHHGNGPDPKRNRGENETMDAVHQGQAGMQQSNGEMRR